MSSAHRRSAADQQAWWATLTPGALADEIRTNRRFERWFLVVVGLLAAGLTVVVLLLHGPIA
jgi:hypothetical protein